MQQVQDMLDFPVDVVSDEELHDRFEHEKRELEKLEKLRDQINHEEVYKGKYCGNNKKRHNASKIKRKAANKARKMTARRR